jgi:hypothetical protein
MVQLSGTYDKGKITLDKKISIDKPVKVMVTFMDEGVTIEKERLTLNDFSFAKSRELLKNVHTNLSDAVIEERRSYL